MIGFSATSEVERIRKLGGHLVTGLPIGESKHSVELYCDLLVQIKDVVLILGPRKG